MQLSVDSAFYLQMRASAKQERDGQKPSKDGHRKKLSVTFRNFTSHRHCGLPPNWSYFSMRLYFWALGECWFHTKAEKYEWIVATASPTRHGFLLYDMFWLSPVFAVLYNRKKTLGMWLPNRLFFFVSLLCLTFQPPFPLELPLQFCRYFAIVGIPLFPSAVLVSCRMSTRDAPGRG